MMKLIVAIILFLLSLLVVFKAPHYLLWLTSVAITNYPFLFIIISAVATFFNRSGRFHFQAAAFSGFALLLFTVPVVMGFVQSNKLPSEIKKVFPVQGELNIKTPFSLFKMFSLNKNNACKTILYKTVEDKKLTFDFYAAAQNKIAPLVIVIHGGSWQGGDSKQLPELNTYLSEKGYNVAAINYRLAPAYKSPAPVEDTKDAINYFLQHAAEFNIDTTNIILLGRSAGAQIALVSAYSLHIPAVKGVISYYGPADMVWGGQIKVNKYVLDTDEIYGNYFGGNYNGVPDKFKEASSIEYVNASSVPSLIIHGKTDPLVSFNHGVRLQKKLNEFGVANYFLQLPFDTHGCDYNLNGPAGQLCTYATEVFLQSITKH